MRMSISDWIRHIADLLVANNLQAPLFALLIFFAFAEAALFVGFVLPGETALVVGGVLAAEQIWSIRAFLIAAVIAAIVGDSVGYEIGRIYGERMKTTRFGRLVGAKRWQFAERVFEKYHGQTIFFARAQALLRSLVPALAGMHRVRYFSFLKWNAAGGAIFSSAVILISYYFANYLHTVERYLRYWAIFVVIVLISVIFYLKKKFENLYDV